MLSFFLFNAAGRHVHDGVPPTDKIRKIFTFNITNPSRHSTKPCFVLSSKHIMPLQIIAASPHFVTCSVV